MIRPARFRQLERSPVQPGAPLHDLPERHPGHRSRFLERGQPQRPGPYPVQVLPLVQDPARDALRFAQPGPVVDPAQRLHPQLDGRGSGHRLVERRALLAQNAFPDAVHVHHRPVPEPHHLQRVRLPRSRNVHLVADQAPVDAQLLERRRDTGLRRLRVAQRLQHAGQRCPSGQLRPHRRREPGRLRRQSGKRTVRERAEHVPEQPELLRRPPVLVDRRVVVVRRHRRPEIPVLQRAGPVGPRPAREVGSPVCHVDVHGRPALQDLPQCAGGLCRFPYDRRGTPVLEPAAPELHAHQRPLRLMPPQHLERLARPRAEVRRGEQTGHGAARQHVVLRPVGGEQRHAHPVLAQQVRKPPQMDPVAAVAPVLVLHLDHEHRAAAVDLPLHHLRQELGEPPLDRRRITGVTGPHPPPEPARHPRGQPAVLPLGADVRARADDRPQPGPVRRVQEPAERRHVPVHPGPRLMEVPRDVRLDAVEAHRAEHREPVVPLLLVHPEVVQRPRQQAYGLPVEPEVVVAHGEVSHRARTLLLRRSRPWTREEICVQPRPLACGRSMDKDHCCLDTTCRSPT